MGKSRLVSEFVDNARRGGIQVALGECQSYGSYSPILSGREIWFTLLRVNDAAPVDEQLRALKAEIAAIDPALVPRTPLLATLLDLPIPDNELTASFDAKLRKTSLEGLLVGVSEGSRTRRRS